ncbi:MAG TPA: type II secretion system minor pseudopilin GspK [Rhodanobacteraceae bacterium]|nr:type II secretion system minor pseudopilin GspK [Rhodanobacteraceae bacterium]
MNGARGQRGIALLIALLTVALAAVLIAGLLDRGELALARTRNAIRGEQAEAYAQGLEAYAARVLLKDSDQGDDDSNTDLWAMPMPPQAVPGGTIRASMRDLNGCFNLNNLASPNSPAVWQRMFGRLLAVRGVDPSVQTAVQDWLGATGSEDVNTTDAYYLAQPVPYRSARRVFAHVSELRLVRGVTGEVYARLAPYVCALPPGSHLNVNTASVPVLQTLGQNISQAQAENLWQNGQAHADNQFRNTWSNMGIAIDPGIGDDMIGVRSSYFLARSDIDLDGVPFTFFSVIQRPGLIVIARSRGSDAAPAVPDAPAATMSR